ncbi:MAG TPA: enoyl-CoA hydratase-related protein [Oceanobacillus sp.]|nr:enoyl-CoA hydratase-related protein [Oceanobacillus sp.]
MTDYQTLLIDIVSPFAYVTLNRPAQRNAMSFKMIEEIIDVFTELRERTDIRAVVLSGAGGHFSAGGDIADMKNASAMSEEEQDATTARLDTMLRAVNQAPQVVVAKVDGVALGGGFGLVCVSDIAIASTTASFGLPEVRIGLVPAVIAPYVVQRIGLTRTRILMLTGTRFDGVSAHEYGVVHEVCPSEILDECTDAILNELRQCSPAALAACKQLLFESTGKPLDETVQYRARLLNSIRRSDEGQEGMTAFLQKRPPNWAKE